MQVNPMNNTTIGAVTRIRIEIKFFTYLDIKFALKGINYTQFGIFEEREIHKIGLNNSEFILKQIGLKSHNE